MNRERHAARRGVNKHRLPGSVSMHDGEANAFVPSSIAGLVRDWMAARWSTPFGRFFRIMIQSTLDARGGVQRVGTNPVPLVGATSVFPMPLPYPNVARGDLAEGLKPFERRRLRKQITVQQLTNLLVALACFYDADCPKGGGALRFVTSELTDAQQSAAQRFQEDAELFCAASGGVIGSTTRGRGRLNSMVLSMGHRYSEAGRVVRASQAFTVAEEVIPAKISLPARAGHILGSSVMCEERAKVFRDLSVLRDDDNLVPGKHIRPCHRIERDAELQFLRTLAERDMIAFIDEAEVERHPVTGEVLRGGFFAVHHKEGRLRLIYDRRPQNALEADLSPEWLRLPHGSQFCEMILQPGEGLRGSTDDLECWFYQLRHHVPWWKMQAVGRRVLGSDVGLGLNPHRYYRACLKVVAMGDKNGVPFAQEAHEFMLRSQGLLGPDVCLRFGASPPLGDVWQGAYVDDFVVSLRAPLHRLGCYPDHSATCSHCKLDGGRLKDVDVTEKLVTAYESFDATRSADKATRFKETFTAWGTTVEGRAGRVGVSLDKRRQISRLAYAVARYGYSTRTVLESLVGTIVHPFMHARHLMSTLLHTYPFIMNMGPEEVRLPAAVVDELLACSILLCGAYTDIRAQVSTSISATDATPIRGGACRAVIPQKLSNALFRRGEQRGEHGMLRWTDLEAENLPCHMQRPSADLDELVIALPWCDGRGWDFARTLHINLQEMAAVIDEVQLRISQGLRRSRVVIIIDSRVVVGAIAKGRSSSKPLNAMLRKLSMSCMCARVQLRVVWASTTANPADAPSRHCELPARGPLPVWASDLFAGAALAAEKHGHSSRSANVVPCRIPGLPHQRILKQKEKKTNDEDAFMCEECDTDVPTDYLVACSDCDSTTIVSGDEDVDRKSRRRTSTKRLPRATLARASYREYYSGHGGLSRAHRRRGRSTREYDAFASGVFDPSKDLSDPQVIDREIADAEAGLIAGAHFGLLCASWCRMTQKWNGGTRTNENPYGSGCLQREIDGNRQLSESWRLMQVFLRLGIPFTVENPVDSLLWRSAEMQALKLNDNVSDVVLDQCMFSLRPPDWSPGHKEDLRVRKRTRVVGTVKNLVSIKRMCDKQHEHCEAIGSVRVHNKTVSRTKAAGVYPPTLCRKLAELFP